MGGLETLERLEGERHDLARRRPVRGPEEVAQRPPREKLHDQVGLLTVATEVEDAGHVGDVEVSGQARLPEETLRDLRIGHPVGPEELEGETLLELHVLDGVDQGCAARTEQSEHPIAIAHDQADLEVAHATRLASTKAPAAPR